MTAQLRRFKFAWATSIAALCAGACSPGAPDDDAMGIGGASATGGGPSAGGSTISSGGAPSIGGASGSGGAPPGSGGGTSGGANTGGAGAGGRGTGGANDGSGGATGGASAAGGATAAGGGAATCTPEPNCEPAPPDTGDFHEDCLARINQFRACLCLTPLVRHTEGEECASQQAQYDYENDSYHAGIRAKICSPANLNNAAQNECPGYPSVDSTIGLCNQQMFDEGECEDFEVCGHYLNMMDPDAESVACGYYETPSGEVWMVENFYF